jgi:hypothetical protein
MNSSQQNKLTVLVKRFLDLTWYLFIFFAVVWPIVVLVVGLSISGDPAQRHTDINMFSGFKISSDVSTGTAENTQDGPALLLSGRGDVKIENTRSRMSWYLSGAISQILLLMFLVGLRQMRRLFTSLADGEIFTEKNTEYVRALGYVVIAWNIVLPVLQQVGGRLMLDEIAFDAPGIVLYPSFELDIGGIFIGLAILVLSGVLREAVSIKQDQALTI